MRLKWRKKNVNGKWIHCKMCDVRIKVRSQFCVTKWQMYTDGVKHKELDNSNAVKKTHTHTHEN